MKKIGELNTTSIHFVIYYDERDKYNHYKIYKKYWDNGWHRKLLDKYADLYSVTWLINEYVSKHNEEDR